MVLGKQRLSVGRSTDVILIVLECRAFSSLFFFIDHDGRWPAGSPSFDANGDEMRGETHMPLTMRLSVVAFVWTCSLVGLEALSSNIQSMKHLSVLPCKRPLFNTFLPLLKRDRKSKRSLSGAVDSVGESNEEQVSRLLNRMLTREFFAIGFPAFVQLAAEPLAALVDTAYLGRLGPDVLGGAGVAISAQYAVSKLYNDPLLRTSISLVASQDGKSRGSEASTDDQKDLSIAVSSALLLAFTVGVVQLVLYSVLASGIIQRFGVTSASPMWHSAVSYLRIRALGTPAATCWLVVNGIFRGLGDTRTPLIYSLIFTGLNAILDPIFIFNLKFGASGAAAGTAIAQYIALAPLIIALNKRVHIDILGQLKELGNSLRAYLQAGGYVLFRTMGKVLAYAVCAREVVRWIDSSLSGSSVQTHELYATGRSRFGFRRCLQPHFSTWVRDDSDMRSSGRRCSDSARQGNGRYEVSL